MDGGVQLNSFRTTTGFFQSHQVSLHDQYRNLTVRLMQSKSTFQRWWPVCFYSNTVFWIIYLLYCLHSPKICKRSVEKYRSCGSYGTLSKGTHFLCVFCEVGVVQQRTETQAGMVQDGLNSEQYESRSKEITCLPEQRTVWVCQPFLGSFLHQEAGWEDAHWPALHRSLPGILPQDHVTGKSTWSIATHGWMCWQFLSSNSPFGFLSGPLFLSLQIQTVRWK